MIILCTKPYEAENSNQKYVELLGYFFQQKNFHNILQHSTLAFYTKHKEKNTNRDKLVFGEEIKNNENAKKVVTCYLNSLYAAVLNKISSISKRLLLVYTVLTYYLVNFTV